jgi:hypothetical protein
VRQGLAQRRRSQREVGGAHGNETPRLFGALQARLLRIPRHQKAERQAAEELTRANGRRRARTSDMWPEVAAGTRHRRGSWKRRGAAVDAQGGRGAEGGTSAADCARF